MSTKKQKIVFVCFIYSRDAGCAKILAEYTARHPEHTLVLVDDKANPVTYEQEMEFRQLSENVFYWQSDFYRNGNLNGAAAVKGIHSTMTRIGRMFNAAWVCKIDPDGVWTPSLIEALHTTDKNVVTTLTAAAGNTVYMCGALYAIRTEVVARMVRLFDGLMARFNEDAVEVHAYLGLGHCKKLLPEDQTGQQLVRCMGEPMDITPLGWYDHGRQKCHYTNSRAVSFGCYETLERPPIEEIERLMRDFTATLP